MAMVMTMVTVMVMVMVMVTVMVMVMVMVLMMAIFETNNVLKEMNMMMVNNKDNHNLEDEQ